MERFNSTASNDASYSHFGGDNLPWVFNYLNNDQRDDNQNFMRQNSVNSSPADTTNLSRTPENLSLIPENMNRTPENINRTPENMNRTPENINRTPENMNRTPANMNRATENMNHTPENMISAPANLSRAQANPFIRLPDNGGKYWGLAVDKASDRLYISDRACNDILVINPFSGTILGRFGSNYLYRPTGIAVDEISKRILICDKDNHRVVFASLNGNFISSFGRRGHDDGQFNYPWDIAISPNGQIIAVSDSRNHRIQFFDRLGNFTKKFSIFQTSPFEYRETFDYPRGVVFGNDGKHLFITDFNTNNVVKLNLESMQFQPLLPPGNLKRPQGIAIDDVGSLLVCDSRNHCVRSIKDTNRNMSICNVGQRSLSIPTDIEILSGGRVAVLGINGIIHFF